MYVTSITRLHNVLQLYFGQKLLSSFDSILFITKYIEKGEILSDISGKIFMDHAVPLHNICLYPLQSKKKIRICHKL